MRKRKIRARRLRAAIKTSKKKALTQSRKGAEERREEREERINALSFFPLFSLLESLRLCAST